MIVLAMLVLVIVVLNVLVVLGTIEFTQDYLKGAPHDKYPFY